MTDQQHTPCGYDPFPCPTCGAPPIVSARNFIEWSCGRTYTHTTRLLTACTGLDRKPERMTKSTEQQFQDRDDKVRSLLEAATTKSRLQRSADYATGQADAVSFIRAAAKDAKAPSPQAIAVVAALEWVAVCIERGEATCHGR